MSIKLAEVYIRAKEDIISSLQTNTLVIQRYNTLLNKVNLVTNYEIEDLEEEYIGSIGLMLEYKERAVSETDSFEVKYTTQTIKLLSTFGDNIWPATMVMKVWNGDYPSTIAINESTGVVYLVYLKLSALVLVEFAILEDVELEAIKEYLNDTTPYSIKIEADAMFNVLSEREGTRHLAENVYIELDVGTKIKVKARGSIIC